MHKKTLVLVALVIGLPLMPWACAPAEEEPEPAPQESVSQQEGQFFDADGVQIHYTDQGEGEPVVVMHGYAMSLDRMETLVSGLVDAGYRVLAMDARGHGGSDKPHDPAQYGAQMAQDVVRLLDHLGLDEAHVMGYSMGGSIANKVRQLHPDRLQTAVIGGSGWLKEGDPALAGMTGDAIADELEENGSFEMMLRKFTENREPPPTDEEIASRNENMLRGNDPSALAAVMRAWHEFAVPEADLRENEVPTIAIVGENDPLKVQVDAMEEVMGNLEVVVIEGATHGALSDPAFLENLVDFLERHGMSATDTAEPPSNQ